MDNCPPTIACKQLFSTQLLMWLFARSVQLLSGGISPGQLITTVREYLLV